MPIVSVIPARHGRSTAPVIAAELSRRLGIGGVTDDSAVWRARADTDATLAIEYSTSSDLSGSTTSDGVAVDSTTDLTGGGTITGLSANTTYYYSIKVNGARAITSNFPSFTTAPAEGEDASFKFVVVSCQKRSTDSVTGAWAAAAAESPAFQIHLGDFVYGDYKTLATLRQAYQDEYTGDQQTYVTDVMWRAQTKDDHDSGGNGADGGTSGIANTRQVWREYVPSFPLWDATKHIGYSFKYANAEFFVVDTREQRESSRPRYPESANSYADAQSGTDEDTVVFPSDAASGSGYPGWYLKAHDGIGGPVYVRRVTSYVGATKTATIDRAITGMTAGWKVAVKRASLLDKDNLGAGGQIERLCDGIINSTARWKFFLTSIVWNARVLTPPGSVSDTWYGWDTERFERSYILQKLKDAGVKNLIILSGDRHFLGIDDGTTLDDYPELCASGFHRVALDPVMEWSHGTYKGTNFGLIEVDGEGHTVTISGKNSAGSVPSGITPLVLEYAA